MAYRALQHGGGGGAGLLLSPTDPCVHSFSNMHKLLCVQCTGDSAVNKPSNAVASQSSLLQTGGDRETIKYKQIIRIISSSGKISKERNTG